MPVSNPANADRFVMQSGGSLVVNPNPVRAADGSTSPITTTGRRFSMVAYNGGRMRPMGWGSDLVVDLAGVEVGPEKLPILIDHNPDFGSVLGQATEVKIGRSGITASGDIYAVGDDAKAALSLIDSGYESQASIGGSILSREFVDAGVSVVVNGQTFTGPLSIARKSTLVEISAVVCGADPRTSVSLNSKGSTMPMNVINENTNPASASPPPGQQPQTVHAADPIAAERERVAKIVEVTSRFSAGSAVAQQAIREGWEPQRAELEALRASRPVVNPTQFGPSFSGSASTGRYGSQMPTDATILAAAILTRAGHEKLAETAYGAQAMNAMGPMRNASMLELCAAALRMQNMEVPSSRTELIRAAASTSTLPTALGNAANKVMESAYVTAPPTWRSWCAIRPAANFKDQKSVRPSFGGELEKVGNGGEVKHGTVGESVFGWNIDTYAKNISVTRQDIINDDLNIFQEVLPGLGLAAARSLANLIYKTLLANGGSFFSVGNKNLISGGGSALALAGLSLAIKTMRQQTDQAGNVLDIQPAVLAVPPELETTARQLLNSVQVSRNTSQDNLPQGNPFQGLCQLEVEPRLSNANFTGNSATGWYLFSPPANAAMVVGFLDGNQTPQITQFGFDSNPNTLAMTWQCVYDFGAALGDSRAALKSAGA